MNDKKKVSMVNNEISPYINEQHMDDSLFKLYNKVYEATTYEESIEIYRKWAPFYEQSEAQNGWYAPEMCADLLLRNLSKIQCRHASILDVAAGTGLVGVALHNITKNKEINLKLYALDRSPDMLSIAKTKEGIYESFFIGEAQHITDATNPIRKNLGNTLDAIICVGAMNPGHILPEAVWDFASIVRPGGVIVFSMKDTFMQESGIGNIMLKGEELNRWRVSERYYTELACKDDAHHHICLQVI